MFEVMSPEKPRVVRSDGVRLTTLSLTKHAHELLRLMSPTKKSFGHLVSSLIMAEYARRSERLALRQGVRDDVEGNNA
jgi:hypothetical protein